MKLFITTLFILSGVIGSAQKYAYLEEIKLKKKSSYKENEANLIKAVDYLMSSSVSSTDADRKYCSRFIIVYATGTPNQTVTLDSYVGDLYEDNDDVLVMYMGLWIKYAINNPSADQEATELYILEELYKYAKKGNNIKQTETIKSLIEAGGAGTLKDFLKKLKE